MTMLGKEPRNHTNTSRNQGRYFALAMRALLQSLHIGSPGSTLSLIITVKCYGVVEDQVPFLGEG